MEMRYDKMFLLFFVCFCFLIGNNVSYAQKEYVIFVELVKDGQREMFAYDKGRFIYQQGDVVYEGKEAKEKVETMLQTLHIHKKQTVVSMVDTLRRAGYEVEKLDVRFINEDGKLYTWVWKK